MQLASIVPRLDLVTREIANEKPPGDESGGVNRLRRIGRCEQFTQSLDGQVLLTVHASREAEVEFQLPTHELSLIG
jgi:hypothetical protein